MSDADRLQVFLYVLMRDFVLVGDVESILEDHVAKLDGQDGIRFDSPHLAALASEIAGKLRSKARWLDPRDATDGAWYLCSWGPAQSNACLEKGRKIKGVWHDRNGARCHCDPVKIIDPSEIGL